MAVGAAVAPRAADPPARVAAAECEPPVLRRGSGGAFRTGGGFAGVFAVEKRATSAVLDAGRIEELSSGRDRGAGIRVVVGETTGFAHTAEATGAHHHYRPYPRPQSDCVRPY